MEKSVSKRRKRRDRFSELPNSDRFSELPNSLIHLILSFLPMKDVVLTTFLSKRWRNLWTTVPYLNFCELNEYCGWEIENARAFVNRALLFWTGVGILKFKLDINWVFDSPLTCDIDLWVRFAVVKKVEELNISLCDCDEEFGSLGIEGSKELVYWLPPCLNSCSSIRELSLVGCNLRVPVPPSWNQLKSLKIDGYCFSKRVINRILLGSPRLEVFELRLVESYENLNIQSTSLKKLKIEKYLFFESDVPSRNKVLIICCPNLEILSISGVLYSEYLFTNVSSVIDVTLGFNGSYNYACGNELLEETLEQIFSTFQHVDKVALSYWCVQVLGVLQKKYLLPSLPNVLFFCNLKMLVIKDQTLHTEKKFYASKKLDFEANRFHAKKYLHFETKLSKSFMQQLTTVVITSFLCETSLTFRFVKFLLKDASMLEKLVIRVNEKYYVGWCKVAKRLMSMPRSSPNAKVILEKC